MYLVDVKSPVFLDGSRVQGYRCVIPMRPPFHLTVERSHPVEGEPHPTELSVKCIDREKEVWSVVDN